MSTPSQMHAPSMSRTTSRTIRKAFTSVHRPQRICENSSLCGRIPELFGVGRTFAFAGVASGVKHASLAIMVYRSLWAQRRHEGVRRPDTATSLWVIPGTRTWAQFCVASGESRVSMLRFPLSPALCGVGPFLLDVGLAGRPARGIRGCDRYSPPTHLPEVACAAMGPEKRKHKTEKQLGWIREGL